MTLDYISESAFHEAAHAVVAAHLKLPLRYATVAGEGGHVTIATRRVRLYLSNRRGGYRERTGEEIKTMSREHDGCLAVAVLAARAALENMEFEGEDGNPLPLCEGQFDGDEQALREIALDLRVDDFAAWRARQLDLAREIVAISHVQKAIDLVAKYLEVERGKHANGTGNGRLAAKEVRWTLRALRALEKKVK